LNERTKAGPAAAFSGDAPARRAVLRGQRNFFEKKLTKSFISAAAGLAARVHEL